MIFHWISRGIPIGILQNLGCEGEFPWVHYKLSGVKGNSHGYTKCSQLLGGIPMGTLSSLRCEGVRTSHGIFLSLGKGEFPEDSKQFAPLQHPKGNPLSDHLLIFLMSQDVSRVTWHSCCLKPFSPK